jgi:hypothetical protein
LPVEALNTVPLIVPFRLGLRLSKPGTPSVSLPPVGSDSEMVLCAETPMPRSAKTEYTVSTSVSKSLRAWYRLSSAVMIAVRSSSIDGSFGLSGIASVTRCSAMSEPCCMPYFARSALLICHSVAVQISPSACTSGPTRS